MSSESASVRSEVAAFQDLALLVHHLEDELASFRRRALAAEARVKELEPNGGSDSADVAELRRENAQLKERVESATARTRQLLDRVRFVRQQATKGEK